MQFSRFEHEITNSPLKCTTNNDMSADKHTLSKQVYGNEKDRKSAANSRESPSPTKPSASRLTNMPTSPVKSTVSLQTLGENTEDPSYRSPP